MFPHRYRGTNASGAGLFTVFAKTDEKISAFLVERAYPGVTIGAEEKKMGIKGSSTCAVYFDSVAVPKENLLGELNRGHVVAFNILNLGRMKLGAFAVGGMKDVVALSARYAKERKAFGPSIADFGLIGKELGGRPADKTCYEDGRVQYRRVAATTTFRAGIERILAGAQSYRIALMCAEREPLECHRTLLVAPELEKAGVRVSHVHADGKTEPHSDAMSRLLELFKLPDENLFRSRSELIEEACYRQQERVAFTERLLPRDAGQGMR